MSALSREPENTNYLQPTKFILSFVKIPDTQYFCQAVNLPGMRIGSTEYDTPFRNIPIAGTKIDYNSLNISFNVNGNLGSWMNLHQWMRSMGSPVGFDDRKSISAQISERSSLQAYSDATLVILNNLNNPIGKFEFRNVFPTTLSDLDFNTTMSADDVMVGNATFEFEYYDFVAL